MKWPITKLFRARTASFLLENKTLAQTVAKNTVWLSISNFGGRLFKAIIIIYGARIMGAGNYGIFSYAVTLAGFFTLFVDPGINFVLVREGAKLPREGMRSLFAQALLFKIGLILFSASVIVMIAPFFSTLPGAETLLPLVALIVIFDGVREFFASLFRAEEKMQKEAAAMLAANLGIVISGFIFMLIRPAPLYFTAAYAAGAGIGACVATWLGRDIFRNLPLGTSPKYLLGIVKMAWPFAIAGGLGSLLTSTDILIISWLRTAEDVGVYSAAIRIIHLLNLIPGIILLSTMPVLARLAKGEPRRFREVTEEILSYVFLISIPLSIGGAILGTKIMRFVFGLAYTGGGTSFSILAISLLFDYAGIIIINALFAYNLQKSFVISTAIGASVNIVLDLVFIPRWGISGSALATLIAQMTSNSYLWIAMQKTNPFEILPKIRKMVIAGAFMAGITLSLALIMDAHVITNVAISGIAYFVVLCALREPAITKIRSLLGIRRILPQK